jgi:hypothetical protein
MKVTKKNAEVTKNCNCNFFVTEYTGGTEKK